MVSPSGERQCVGFTHHDAVLQTLWKVPDTSFTVSGSGVFFPD